VEAWSFISWLLTIIWVWTKEGQHLLLLRNSSFSGHHQTCSFIQEATLQDEKWTVTRVLAYLLSCQNTWCYRTSFFCKQPATVWLKNAALIFLSSVSPPTPNSTSMRSSNSTSTAPCCCCQYTAARRQRGCVETCLSNPIGIWAVKLATNSCGLNTCVTSSKQVSRDGKLGGFVDEKMCAWWDCCSFICAPVTEQAISDWSLDYRAMLWVFWYVPRWYRNEKQEWVKLGWLDNLLLIEVCLSL
jgi:hypothetical protein